MIEVVRYKPDFAQEWDAFVDQAKNGHFMFKRGYLQYHEDRFIDASLLFYRKGKLIAVLPAHQQEQQLISHGGLTFGGLVTDAKMTLALMQEVFVSIKHYMQQEHLVELLYRPIPAYYHTMPAQEDVAVLYILGAELVARDIISVIDLRDRPKYYKGVRWSLGKARKAGLTVQRTSEFAEFMQMLTCMLKERYEALPVHTLFELMHLASLYPNNIQLFQVHHSTSGELLAGAVLYLTDQVVHTQYIASTTEGKQQGAVALLMHALMEEFRASKAFFSLGTSRGGTYVNESLLHFKESLGARAMLQEQYRWRVSQ